MNLKKLEKIFEKASSSKEEKDELLKITDEIVHHRVVGCILDNLDKKEHEAFLKDINNYQLPPNIIKKVEKTIKNLEKEILLEL